MPVIVLACPICKKKYKITVDNTAILAQKTFLCPACKYSAPFTQLIKGLPQPQPVTNPNKEKNKTLVAGQHPGTLVRPGMGMSQVQAYLTVLGNGSKYVLNPGIYILGRKSSDSMATLQLAPDIAMSRQHARLSVQLVSGKLMAQIQSMKADNPVLVNGKACPAGKACVLMSGDRITLGNTHVLFSF